MGLVGRGSRLLASLMDGRQRLRMCIPGKNDKSCKQGHKVCFSVIITPDDNNKICYSLVQYQTMVLRRLFDRRLLA